MTDYLAEAKTAAEQGYNEQVNRYALVASAEDVRRIADRLDANTAELLTAATTAGAEAAIAAVNAILGMTAPGLNWTGQP
jgi:hypothetical protein